MGLGSKDWAVYQTGWVADYIRYGLAENATVTLYPGLPTKLFYLTSWWCTIQNNTVFEDYGTLYIKTPGGATYNGIYRSKMPGGEQRQMNCSLSIPFLLPIDHDIVVFSPRADVQAAATITGYEKTI